MKNSRKIGLRKTIGIIMAILFVIFILFLYIIDANTYHATISPEDYVQKYDDVEFRYIGRNMFFDGPGEDTLFVFYQGAFVQTEAYAPLLIKLANAGVDCLAIHAPLNIAFLTNYTVDSYLEKDMREQYKHHYIGGHSLGGYYVTDYAFKHADEIDGLVHLAAYGTNDYSKSELPVLSIYGSCDNVLSREALTISEFFMPSSYTSVCIEGANHAQFGAYGKQKGDGIATITPGEQWKITTNEIVKFVNAVNESE